MNKNLKVLNSAKQNCAFYHIVVTALLTDKRFLFRLAVPAYSFSLNAAIEWSDTVVSFFVDLSLCYVYTVMLADIVRIFGVSNS